MATSGNFATNNTYIVYYFEGIENSTDTTNNTSNVTVRLWAKRTNTGYTTYGTGTAYCTINGSSYSQAITTSQKITSTAVKLFEKTVTVTHNTDGTKTLDISGYISMDVVTSSSHSWSMGLTTIPRASQPSLSDMYVWMRDETVTINTNRASTSFTHTIKYSFGGASGTIATGVGASTTWTPPVSLSSQIPNDTYGNGSIICETYSGSTLIGTNSTNIQLYIPSDIAPTFTSITHVEGETAKGVATKIGAYVQSLSQLKMTINGATGVYGSTISKYEFTVDATTYTGNNSISNIIQGSGTLTLTGKITDSRGRTASSSVSVTVLAYSAPKVTTFTVTRANSDGTLNDMGTYAETVYAGTFNSLNSNNSTTIYVKSKLRNSSTWTTVNTSAVTTTGSFNTTLTLGTYTATSSYDFRVEIVDQFNTTLVLTALPTGEVTMSWAPGGVGIGKVWEQGVLDVDGDVYVNGNINLGTNQLVGRLSSERIPAYSNLNNYTTPGMYYCPLSADTQTMSNTASNNSFSLLVENHAGVKQTWTDYTTSGWVMFVRNYYSGSWGQWIQIVSKQTVSWTNLALQNGWVWYGTTGTSWGYPAYYKNELGEVIVKGIIRSGTATAGTTIAVLPAGYRPKDQKLFPIIDGANSLKRLDLTIAGELKLGWAVNSDFLTIDLPPFVAEQ